ncbi:enhanced serine sensitivity protein SseB C-terminal domain-containing protein [Saccharibacillus brassicae]|nr:enhanced serine sensitivity protein SseB C-terminal domain-containing protein [Saccharibacillus brassicae]
MSFTPQNRLEIALSEAVEYPSRRRAFYEELQRAELYALHMEGDVPVEDGMIREKAEVRLPCVEIEGKTYLPVFSSLEMLQRSIEQEMRYISMNAMDLFGLVRGSDVWLNPGAPFAKQFPATEIESILDGSLLAMPQSYTLDTDRQIMLGRPVQEPTELLSGLSEVFRSFSNVKLAYSAHYYNPESGDPPHTLIAVEAEGEWEEVVRAASLRASSACIPDPPVDFVRLDGLSGLERYFEADCEPFYRKFGRLKQVVRRA